MLVEERRQLIKLPVIQHRNPKNWTQIFWGKIIDADVHLREIGEKIRHSNDSVVIYKNKIRVG